MQEVTPHWQLFTATSISACLNRSFSTACCLFTAPNPRTLTYAAYEHTYIFGLKMQSNTSVVSYRTASVCPP